ncbi:hypothetical protein EPUL_001725 [Erysiphe pulchra]|uniref:Uncharacterized protein n=1 Tax=Erysiphe pulchra TaxID=225359 RepID=A0A2S4PTY7_9PEZI|nr:hypothetical protein EPUL_001725 [Erysiphe pulchra]
MSILDLLISWILTSYLVSTHTILDRREWKENGYDCGDAFFNDQMVHDALKTALSDIGRKKILLYTGPIYSRVMGYVTWPILPAEAQAGRFSHIWRRAMYQIVFDANGKVIDLIVRLANNQFAKCWRVDSQQIEASIYSVEESNGYKCGYEFIPDSTITECVEIARKNLAPDTDELNQIFAKPPRNGYMCDKVFFDDNDLQHARVTAQRREETKRSTNFPRRYNGKPFDSPCLLWPINKNGESFTTGRLGKYRLVLTLDFKILSVAMFIPGGFLVRNSYQCFEDVFSHEEIASIAEIACKKAKRAKRKTFPLPYQGLKFDVEGPYLLYPIKKHKFSPGPGIHRLVINTLCHIAGVLTMDPNTKELVKCSVEGQKALQES